MAKLFDTTQTITIHCKIVAIEEGQYTAIVVEDLNRIETDDLKYVTVVKCPNWDISTFEIGDIGYLQFQYVEGGKTQWYNKDSKGFEIYKYTNNYFISFIKEKDIYNQKEFNF